MLQQLLSQKSNLLNDFITISCEPGTEKDDSDRL